MLLGMRVAVLISTTPSQPSKTNSREHPDSSNCTAHARSRTHALHTGRVVTATTWNATSDSV
eukprot:4252322-Pyramimonas_sp.AAC.1